MSKKKSYMNKSNLINEGFFDKLSKFLRARPKVKSKKKPGLLKQIMLQGNLYSLNRSVADFEKSLKDLMGDDYPDMPRFKASDFIK